MPTYSIRLVCDEGPEPLTGEILNHAEETFILEAPTPWEGRRRAISRMTISPMGRLLRAYDATTGDEILPLPLPDLRPGVFMIDGLPGEYQGFTRDETWNGFAVPYFPLAEAQRIVEDYVAQPKTADGEMKAKYDAEGELFRMYEPANEEWEEYPSLDISGHTLYPIGTRYWTWMELSASDG